MPNRCLVSQYMSGKAPSFCKGVMISLIIASVYSITMLVLIINFNASELIMNYIPQLIISKGLFAWL